MAAIPFLIALLFALPPSLAGNCNADDQKALLAIKSSFHNANHFASWTPSSPCCDWYGVECDASSSGRVTGLFVIDDSNLTGSIPAAVGDLPFLTYLSFRQLPNLVGPIPSSASRLARLSVLMLNFNSLSGSIPAFLSNITSLTVLDLSSNGFSGPVPQELALLPNIRRIDLSRNNLSGAIPAAFGRFPPSSPPDLLLSQNFLSGELSPELGVPEWGIVDLSWNGLTGDASVLFGSGKATTQIDLSRNAFAFNLSLVTFPEKLTNLDLSDNLITGSIPAQINQVDVKSLNGFNVSNNHLCGEIPTGPVMAKFGPDSYANNKCLCGPPLPPCA